MVRLCGEEALPIARRLCPGPPAWRDRRAALRRVRLGGDLVDEAVVVWMDAPRTLTGEPVVELSTHGNPVIVERLLDACVALGARVARPGEFTRRALVNGRIDLLRAEAVAAMVEAETEEGVRLAGSALAGGSVGEIASLREALLDAAAELEARLDHPGDELGFEDDEALGHRLEAIAARAAASAETWRAGRVRLHGGRVALVGPVNAGKSSLFNHLVGERRALVSPEPGTTRDVVERSVVIDGLEVTFYDTAGERAGAGGLEAAGVELGRALVRDVDLRVLVVSLVDPPGVTWHADVVVGTHLDLGMGLPNARVDHRISNASGEGIADLRADIRRRLGGALPAGARFVALSQRQHDLLREVAERALLARGALLGPLGPAVAAREAALGLERIAELTGADSREDVLDRVFSRFCVGK